MEYLVAVSSPDGKLISQHFGHTDRFLIVRVEDNRTFTAVERRPVRAPCQGGVHDDQQLAETISLLADCKYVLSTRIGRGAQAALQAAGITPLEIEHFVDYALEKVMHYDSKWNHDKQERRN